MPVVGGLSRAAAIAALKRARLDIGKVTEEYSRSVLDGTVLRASERTGTLLLRGTDIDLVVSIGPQPLTFVNRLATAPAFEATRSTSPGPSDRIWSLCRMSGPWRCGQPSR